MFRLSFLAQERRLPPPRVGHTFRSRRVAVFLSAFWALVPIGAFANECLTLTLDSSFVIGDIPGDAPAEGYICYDVFVPQGQNMSIEVASGRNVAVTVPGYYDARSDRMFIGNLPGHLEIRAFQVLRAVQPQPFLVRLRFEAPGNG